jgi:hypothetical protein
MSMSGVSAVEQTGATVAVRTRMVRPFILM